MISEKGPKHIYAQEHKLYYYYYDFGGELKKRKKWESGLGEMFLSPTL